MPPAATENCKVIPNRLFVGGISQETTEEDLYRLFASYANVMTTRIIFDQFGSNKGYGFVTFATEEEADKVQCKCQNIKLHNRLLNLKPAIRRHTPDTQALNYKNK